MDRITAIEEQLVQVLKEINSNVPAPSGYTYYNTVTCVNVDDEVVAVDRGEYPLISTSMEPDETILSGNQSAYMNELKFKLKCSVTLTTEVDDPKRASDVKMNELLSDIKACISNNYHLNYTCDLASLVRSTRTYATASDSYRAADLIVYMKVLYSQSRLDPNKNCSI